MYALSYACYITGTIELERENWAEVVGRSALLLLVLRPRPAVGAVDARRRVHVSMAPARPRRAGS